MSWHFPAGLDLYPKLRIVHYGGLLYFVKPMTDLSLHCLRYVVPRCTTGLESYEFPIILTAPLAERTAHRTPLGPSVLYRFFLKPHVQRGVLARRYFCALNPRPHLSALQPTVFMLAFDARLPSTVGPWTYVHCGRDKDTTVGEVSIHRLESLPRRVALDDRSLEPVL